MFSSQSDTRMAPSPWSNLPEKDWVKKIKRYNTRYTTSLTW